MRLSCAGVNFGNICSIRDLVIESPLRVFDIIVIYNVILPDKLSLESFHLFISKRIAKDDTYPPPPPNDFSKK